MQNLINLKAVFCPKVTSNPITKMGKSKSLPAPVRVA